MRGVAYVLGSVGAAIVVGCGIGGTDSLFTSGGAGGGNAAGGHGTGGEVASGNPTAGGGQGAGPGASQSSSAVSSSQMSSSAMSSSAMSSSSGGPDQVVNCGDSVTCPVNGNHACCWDQDTQHDPPPYGMCVQGSPGNDGCNTGGGVGGFHARITCDSPHQCPGGFCCGHEVQLAGGYYVSVDCEASCNDVRICDPMDNTQTCINGTSCEQSGLLPMGYFVCR